jgi:tetratricopeptide (TPR) repeat protein
LLAFARFGHWDDILKEASPGADYPFDRAMWHYARGLAFAAKGKPDEAAQEYAKFAELEQTDKVRAMDNPYFPGTKILAIANEVLAGKIAAARGASDDSLTHLRKAVELQDAMPYMEPPYWYSSTRLSLGAALLKSGNPEEAEKVFRDELKHFPECGWPLFGLEQSLRQRGKNTEANKLRRQFNRAWEQADVALDLAWF